MRRHIAARKAYRHGKRVANPSGVISDEISSIFRKVSDPEPVKTVAQLCGFPDQTVVGWPGDIRELTANIIPAGIQFDLKRLTSRNQTAYLSSDQVEVLDVFSSIDVTRTVVSRNCWVLMDTRLVLLPFVQSLKRSGPDRGRTDPLAPRPVISRLRKRDSKISYADPSSSESD
ncbi:hypothetical protein ON010_g8207 [Phytophthora cinnamomi]|nr:hypothetical protein ON010_g8207 [Phytophthora cinnamomi]